MKNLLNTLLVLLMATVSLSAATTYTGSVCMITEDVYDGVPSYTWSATVENDVVDLTLFNTGTDGVIATIYIQDLNEDITSIGLSTSDTASFGGLQNGGNLPTGNNIGFDSRWYVSANNPKPHNGIAPNENINFVFTGTDLVDSMSNGDIKIGFHTISIGEESATFVLCDENNTFSILPEPSTVMMLGLGSVLLFRRNRPEIS